jgi:cellulose synthase/poly-beta-1,6-N-acetylglucosamine synthase-like glycosyltransferase
MSNSEWLLAGIVMVSGFIIIYHHALFPLFLKRQTQKQQTQNQDNIDGELPSITIIVPAFNETSVIASKVRNIASLIYPPDKLTVVIACDGCSDNTSERAQQTGMEKECLNLSMSVISYKTNRGKVAVLNDTLQNVNSDIVCLTDASAWMSIDALMQAARSFQNEKVGVVAGTYHLYQSGSAGEVAYWQYQRKIKEGEAALGAPLGVHGACYFLRTSALRPLPVDTINDDFILPMRVVIDGYLAVYDPNILALEMEASNHEMDFKRRCRIAAGNTQQAIRMASLLLPRYRGVALAFASGKVLRVVMPYLMLMCLIGSALLASVSIFFSIVFLLQVGGYLSALLRAFVFKKSQSRYLNILHYIAAGHTANLVGSIRYLIGLEKGHWVKVPTLSKKEISS